MDAYSDAVDLATEAGCPANIFPALRGYTTSLTPTGDNRSSLQLGNECLRLPEDSRTTRRSPWPIVLWAKAPCFWGIWRPPASTWNKPMLSTTRKSIHSSAATYGLDLRAVNSQFLVTDLVVAWLSRPSPSDVGEHSPCASIGICFQRSALAMMWVLSRMLRREYRAGKEHAEQLLELASKHGISDCIVGQRPDTPWRDAHTGSKQRQSWPKSGNAWRDYGPWASSSFTYNLGTLATLCGSRAERRGAQCDRRGSGARYGRVLERSRTPASDGRDVGWVLPALRATPKPASSDRWTSPASRRQIVGAAHRDELRPALARSGQAPAGPRPARAGLRLVHRGLRHRRSEGTPRRCSTRSMT